MDASRHLMEDHTDLPDGAGRRLGQAAARGPSTAQTVLVAGAKAATQTPPIRSGKRVVFSTLDDGTGLVDLRLLRRQPRRLRLHRLPLLAAAGARAWCSGAARAASAWWAPRAWNLAELVELRREGGLDAVAAASPTPTPTGRSAGRLTSTVRRSKPCRTGRNRGRRRPADNGRRIHLSTGYETEPLGRPAAAGERAATGRKLWHSSPGSAG